MPFIKDIPLRANKVAATTFNLYAWGDNGWGQYGNGTTVSRSSPVLIRSDVETVSAGYRYTHYIQGGKLFANGNSGFVGRLGTGNTFNYSSPVQIGTATDWTICKNAFQHSGFVRNRYLYTTGENAYGELGNGTTTGVSSPIQIGSQEWDQFDVGTFSSAGIKYDAFASVGTLWSWGYNASGQLGLGDTLSYSSPTQVGGLLDNTWHVISVGDRHAMGLRWDESGTGNYELYVWGDNTFGTIGDGTTTHRSSPVLISSERWISISAGYDCCHGIKDDGTLWAWGSNEFGQLGDGTATGKSSPIQIGSGTNWNSVAFCKFNWHGLAVKTDGTLWTWGVNFDGQLGDSTTTSKSSPVQVGSITTWVIQQEIFNQKTISAGSGYAMAIRDSP